MVEGPGIRPTLLVGVGGTGSRIAQNVYTQAKNSYIGENGRMEVLAFDTDENDKRRLTGLDDRQAIRISTANTIDELLDRYPSVERDWFVQPRSDLPMELRKMTLLEGAAQVRMLSRLALYDAAATGQLENVIGAAVSGLARYDNRTGHEGQVNVLMVGSLAGATGSGSFLQIAALIRDIASKRNIEAGVRGLFLMPDIYVRSGALPQGQIPSVLANGYASFKEFHAITLKATEREGSFDFAFEYAPDRFLQAGDIPLASMVIIDYEDTRGGNLGRSITAYQKLAERAVYTLLFTPVGGKADSSTVNDVRETVSAAGRGTHNRIAAIGICALSYPHAEVIDYLSCRMAGEVLAGDWLRLDSQFSTRIRRFREQRAAGNMTAVEPEQGAAYLEDLRQLALDDGLPFFREIFEALNPTVVEEGGGDTVKPLHEVFLTAFDRQVVSSFWNTEDLTETRDRRPADQGQFASESSLVEEVRMREGRLDDDFRRVEQALVTRPVDIIVNLMSAADDLGEADWRDHHLQTYLVKSGPHPVRCRAFLFALRARILERLPRFRSDDERVRYCKLANTFRDDDEGKDNPTSRSTPNVLKLANDIAQRGLVSRMFKGGMSDFVDDYVRYHNSSIRRLVEFAEARLLEKVYERLLQEVDELIRVSNALFREVGATLAALERRITENEESHEQSSLSENTLYVCADRQCKTAMWEEVREAMVGQRLGPDANRAIMREVYAVARRNRVARKPEGLGHLSELLWRTIVDGFAAEKIGADYTGIHELSLIEAVRREAETVGRDPESLLTGFVEIVNRQSEIMATLTSPTDGQNIRFWAFNGDLRDQMAAIGDPDRLINPAGQGIQTVEEPEFDLTEILSVSLRVNLELPHLAKLSPPYRQDGSVAPDRAGRYFEEYQNMVEELIEAAGEQRPPRTITPHIHRDWHKPGLLPEISDEITRRFVTDVNRAFAVALALEVLHLDVSHNRRVAEVRTVGRVTAGGVSVEIAETHDLFDVLRAFERHPEAVRGCLRLWDEEKGRLAGSADEERVNQVLNPAVIKRALFIAETRRDEDLRDARVADLVTGYAHLVTEMKEVTRPNIPARALLQEVADALAAVGKAALDDIGQQTSAESLRIMEARWAFGVENWRRDVKLA